MQLPIILTHDCRQNRDKNKVTSFHSQFPWQLHNKITLMQCALHLHTLTKSQSAQKIYNTHNRHKEVKKEKIIICHIALKLSLLSATCSSPKINYLPSDCSRMLQVETSLVSWKPNLVVEKYWYSSGNQTQDHCQGSAVTLPTELSRRLDGSAKPDQSTLEDWSVI